MYVPLPPKAQQSSFQEIQGMNMAHDALFCEGAVGPNVIHLGATVCVAGTTSPGVAYRPPW